MMEPRKPLVRDWKSSIGDCQIDKEKQTAADSKRPAPKGACPSRVGSLLEHRVVPYEDIPVTSTSATMAHHFSGRNHGRNMLEHLFIQSKEIRKNSTTTAKNNSSEILP